MQLIHFSGAVVFSDLLETLSSGPHRRTDAQRHLYLPRGSWVLEEKEIHSVTVDAGYLEQVRSLLSAPGHLRQAAACSEKSCPSQAGQML